MRCRVGQRPASAPERPDEHTTSVGARFAGDGPQAAGTAVALLSRMSPALAIDSQSTVSVASEASDDQVGVPGSAVRRW